MIFLHPLSGEAVLVQQVVPSPNRVLGPTTTASTATATTSDRKTWFNVAKRTTTHSIEFVDSQFTFLAHDLSP
jgi:hypothetical protein